MILDGENCWEYYPDGGVSFLRSLYQGAVRDPRIRPVTVGEFLREHPPADTLPRLFAGSWISHNFAIWIGHPEDNRAWDALHADPRSSWSPRSRPGGTTPSASRRAWDEIYIAEGSDWFWWYGDDHSSALDALFDHLFRKHLRNVYTLLGRDPPGSLFTPISQAAPHRPLHDQPNSFLNVKIDGRSTYFEWINAARYACGNERGTMTLVAKGLLQCGLVRLQRRAAADPRRHRGRPGARAAGRGRASSGSVSSTRPAGRSWSEPVRCRGPPRCINHAGEPSSNGTTVEVATGQILELAVPFGRLGLKAGDPIRFYVELLGGDSSLDRAPREGIFELTVPSPDFERIMWQV